ncbi:MAG: 1-deoxy-D-xylulose-5-phosphate reductoisomerase [Spirochaetes bacterium GWF1_51_8]|nr:MAG: 1-deoxy-D-xylulose-5-phosphate reductoisomerase [Spirochaetes bacterium GWF1_51_8]
MERVILLGATGSIGGSALDILRAHRDRFELVGVSGWGNKERLAEIASEFGPRYICLREESREFMSRFPGKEFLFGCGGLDQMAALTDADTVIMAVSGTAGLMPTLSAIRSGKRLLTANKESIVCAGEIIMDEAAARDTELVPLDSEHNAIFNLLTRIDPDTVSEITLTASGGPFREKPIDETVTLEQVLDHPTWDMGRYITANSATLMNKGFEVIEAHHLFAMEYEQIRVMIHPQSLVHGMVRTSDGSLYLSASPSDMRIPISLAMFFPGLPPQTGEPLALGGLTFDFADPDWVKFPMLGLAYECGKAGGLMPAALNAANETIVHAFLDGKVPFFRIPEMVADVLDGVTNKSAPSLDEILETDTRIRVVCDEMIGG